LSWEFWDATTNVDLWERGVIEFVRKHEIILYALKCFLEKRGQFAPESRDVIEFVKK
jgi:hypothetical protein